MSSGKTHETIGSFQLCQCPSCIILLLLVQCLRPPRQLPPAGRRHGKAAEAAVVQGDERQGDEQRPKATAVRAGRARADHGDLRFSLLQRPGRRSRHCVNRVHATQSCFFSPRHATNRFRHVSTHPTISLAGGGSGQSSFLLASHVSMDSFLMVHSS